MGDESERLGESPDRSGVRRIALVEEGVTRCQAGRAGLEVGEEPGQSPSGDEALVHDRVPRRGGDREVGHAPCTRFGLDASAGPEDAEVQIDVGSPACSPGAIRGAIRGHDGLDEGRLRCGCFPSQRRRVAWNRPPASDGESLGLDRRLDHVPGAFLTRSTAREEQLEDRRSVARSDRRIRADPGPKRRLERHGDARAIGRLTVGGERAAMAERGQARQGEGEDSECGPPAGIGDEPDATGIVLVARVVERWILADPSALHRGVATPPAHSPHPRGSHVGSGTWSIGPVVPPVAAARGPERMRLGRRSGCDSASAGVRGRRRLVDRPAGMADRLRTVSGHDSRIASIYRRHAACCAASL